MVLHTTLKRIHVRMRTRPITVPDTSAGVIMAKVNLQAGRSCCAASRSECELRSATGHELRRELIRKRVREGVLEPPERQVTHARAVRAVRRQADVHRADELEVAEEAIPSSKRERVAPAHPHYCDDAHADEREHQRVKNLCAQEVVLEPS